MEKLKHDKCLAKKLDLLEEIANEPSTSSDKRKNFSPLRTRKVVKLSDGSFSAPSSAPRDVGEPTDLGHVVGSDTCGTNIRDKLEISDDEGHSDSSESEDKDDGLSCLEQELFNEATDNNSTKTSDHEESFKILGDSPNCSWTPSETIMNFYLKIADLELSKDILSSIHDEFKADENVQPHFTPPKFPLPFGT